MVCFCNLVGKLGANCNGVFGNYRAHHFTLVGSLVNSYFIFVYILVWTLGVFMKSHLCPLSNTLRCFLFASYPNRIFIDFYFI